MLRAILKCVQRTISDASTWGGVLTAGLGGFSDWLRHPLLLPSWVWWLLATLLLFAAAARAYWELDKEILARRAPDPTIRLHEVVKRIRGKSDIFGPENSEAMEVLKALVLIKEKARNGVIEVYGRSGQTSEADFEIQPRVHISKDYWIDHEIDYLKFEGKKHGRVEPKQGEPSWGYVDIWFDERQIDTLWRPLPRRWKLSRKREAI